MSKRQDQRTVVKLTKAITQVVRLSLLDFQALFNSRSRTFIASRHTNGTTFMVMRSQEVEDARPHGIAECHRRAWERSIACKSR